MDDLTGRDFGRLTVRGYEGKRGKDRYWRCVCQCGKQVVVRGRGLTAPKGATKSCGCLQRERAKETARVHLKPRTTHGKVGTPEYAAWHHMRQRCLDPNHPGYADYGGRGIRICERWDDFAAFVEDMGERPSAAHSLDRIDVNGHYEPGNCRWADHKTQQRNRRHHRMVTWNGVTKCVGEWAEERGLTVPQLWSRLFLHKWPVDRAMTEPVRGTKNLITS